MNHSIFKGILISCVIVLSLWLGWKELKAQGADLLPIKYVRIEGIFQYISKDSIKTALLKQVMTGFFNVDVLAIKQTMLELPWIAHVEVRRVWPDALEIKIYEHYPVARWRDTGLLNEQGEIFIPSDLAKFAKLPLLYGVQGNEKQLMQVMKEMQMDLAQQAMSLASLEVNERRAWKVILSNEIELTLGKKQPSQKLKRFLKTLPILGRQRVRAMQKVDLRYPNGYAVTWK